MAAFVIDASATLPWCFSDEATEATNKLLVRLKSRDEAVVPSHWAFEVANALLAAARRGRINSGEVHQFLDDLEALPIRVDMSAKNLTRTKVLPPQSITNSRFSMRPTSNWRFGRISL